MIGYWISFALIAILVPIGLAGVKVWRENHFECADEQKKKACVNLSKYFIFYWLCDLFYMSCFLNNLICKFVFGGLIVVVVLMNVCFSFTAANAKTTIQKYFMLQDFLVGIGISVYLLYLIPDKELQTIAIAIVSAIYGGLITLAGVAWTIVKSDQNRLADEIKREKPCFSFNPLYKEILLCGFEKMCCPLLDGEKEYRCEELVQLENSNKSSFILKRLFHDGKWFDLEGNFTVLPSGKCYLSFYFDSPLNIVLATEDNLGNEYYYALKVLSMGLLPNGTNVSTSKKAFHTLREIREISKDELPKLIKKSK